MFFEININILAVVHSKTTMMQYIGTSAEQNSKILQNSKTSAEQTSKIVQNSKSSAAKNSNEKRERERERERICHIGFCHSRPSEPLGLGVQLVMLVSSCELCFCFYSNTQ